MGLDTEDRQWILGTLEANMNRFGERMETRFDEKLEGMETRFLSAFHGWGSPVETRRRSHSAALRAIDVELEALKHRVARLENPAA